MTKTTHTYAPYANSGSVLNMAGTILSMGMDAKAILDAAGEMGQATATNSTNYLTFRAANNLSTRSQQMMGSSHPTLIYSQNQTFYNTKY